MEEELERVKKRKKEREEIQDMIGKNEDEGGEKLRKACDSCTVKKIACDSGRPCEQCVKRKLGDKCTYSAKKPTGPKKVSRGWSWENGGVGNQRLMMGM